tara:strand:- start:122 stop:886 length:765 start_codon:yes stop_codon:yes gene_type:complete
MESCDTMWTINRASQTITMKMCVETVVPTVVEFNITNLTIPSLHNTTLNNTKNISFIQTMLNQSNITEYVALPNISNTNDTIDIVESGIEIVTPSSSSAPSSKVLLPAEVNYSSPSSSASSYIRGSSPSSSTLIMLNSTNLTNNSTHPVIITNDNATIVAIVFIIVGILLSLGLTWCLYKRKIKHNKIHDCTPLTSHYRYKKPPKQINTSKPNMNRPKDYLLEKISNASTPKTEPHPPKEVQEDLDIDDKTTLE